MRLRHKKGAETEVLNSPLVINVGDDILLSLVGADTIRPHVGANDIVGASTASPTEHVGASTASPLTSESIFGNSNPLHLELGMGKGKFIIELSKQNTDINYIGIERSATIVLKSIDNYVGDNTLSSLVGADTIRPQHEGELCEPKLNYSNLRFMCENVENLEKIFPPHSIDKIYLNFSDPWPKKRHESRRLTHKKFLAIYEKLLKPGSLLEFKTDNVGLFDFSLEEIKNSNFELLDYTYDLHNDEKLNKNNIMTEYESKFSKMGNKICKLIAESSEN